LVKAHIFRYREKRAMQELLVNPGWIDAGFDPELLVGDLVHYH
jgi:hypothetical protein